MVKCLTSRVMALLTSASISLTGTPATATKNDVCASLKPSADIAAGELFLSTAEFEPRRAAAVRLSSLQSQRVELYYAVKRFRRDWPTKLVTAGAASVKIEAWQSDADSLVSLFNNHRPPNSTPICTSREFETYQSFHVRGTIDPCLLSGFHNPPGEFDTSSPSRRILLAFSEEPVTPMGLFERFLGYRIQAPVKRYSLILNYKLFPQAEATCIPFEVTLARNTSEMRITIDDLLEDPYGNRVPSLSYKW
jgi:hypothetical protein